MVKRYTFYVGLQYYKTKLSVRVPLIYWKKKQPCIIFYFIVDSILIFFYFCFMDLFIHSPLFMDESF